MSATVKLSDLTAQIQLLRPRPGDTVVITIHDGAPLFADGLAYDPVGMALTLARCATAGIPDVRAIVLPDGWRLETAKRRWRRRAHRRAALR